MRPPVTETIMRGRVGIAVGANGSFTPGLYARDMKRPRHYHHPQHHGRRRTGPHHRKSSGGVLVSVALLGAAAVTSWFSASPEQKATALTAASAVGVATGLVRERAPQEGDYWRGCDDARAAGTAPIYRGEPGYREGMDGDGDGIACEPYR